MRELWQRGYKAVFALPLKASKSTQSTLYSNHKKKAA